MNIKKSTDFKFFLFLATLYNMLWFLGIFMNPTVIPIGTLKLSASTIFVVMFFSLNDVITEVYGYDLMKKLIWCTLFNLLIMSALITILLHIPNLSTWPDKDYTEILSQSASVAIIAIISALFASFMNSYFISRLKVTYRGRFYWLRSVISTAVAAFFFTSISYTYRLIHLPFSEAFEFILTAYLVKVTADIVITTPNTFLQYLLKKIERHDAYDVDANYNPFSLKKKKKIKIDG